MKAMQRTGNFIAYSSLLTIVLMRALKRGKEVLPLQRPLPAVEQNEVL